MKSLFTVLLIALLGLVVQPVQAVSVTSFLDRVEHVGKAEKKLLRKQRRAERKQERMERRMARWEKRFERLKEKLAKRGIALGENIMQNNLFRIGVIVAGIGLVVGVVFSWLLWPIGVLGWLAFVAGAIMMIIGGVQYGS